MNILTHKLSQSPILNPLTTSLYFFASKMQASSTQKTKDSAGRRLGYAYLYPEWKSLEISRYIQTTLSPDSEVSSGRPARMWSSVRIRPSMLRSKESSSSDYPTNGKCPSTTWMSNQKPYPIANTALHVLTTTIPNFSHNAPPETTLNYLSWTRITWSYDFTLKMWLIELNLGMWW